MPATNSPADAAQRNAAINLQLAAALQLCVDDLQQVDDEGESGAAHGRTIDIGLAALSAHRESATSAGSYEPQSAIAVAQLERATLLGARARSEGDRCMPYRDGELMALMRDRVGDSTPQGEASSANLIAAWLDGYATSAPGSLDRGDAASAGVSVEDLMGTPLRGPRDAHLGEAAFVSQWRQFLAGDDDGECTPLERVLGCEATVRQGRVAASFICWLGTNVGMGLLDEAERFKSKSVRNPYLHAWAGYNTRQRGVNYGTRPIETLLALESDYGQTSIGWGVIKPVHYTVDDVETVEAVAIWLGTEEGDEFLQGCEAEFRRLQSEHRAERRAEIAARG